MSEARYLADFARSDEATLKVQDENVRVRAVTPLVGAVNAVVIDELGRQLLVMLPVVSMRFSPLRPLSFPHARVAPACIRDGCCGA